MDLGHLFAHPPPIHLDDEGRPRKIAASHALLQRVADSIGPGSRTLETGIGLSTLVFAIKGAEHTCVAPFTEEIERVKSWCEGEGIDLSRMTFCRGRSEKVLPSLPETPLDAVLIDGGHGFPAPFLDWYYAGRRLVPGGTLFVDDTQLWTGAVLRDFLAEQPEWDLVERLPMRAAVLRRKEADDPSRFDEWVHQPYVVKRSWTHGWRGWARRGVRGAEMVRQRVRRPG